MDINDFLDKIKSLFNFVIFRIGKGDDLTIGTIFIIILGFSLLIFLGRKLSYILDEKILIKRIPDKGTRVALVTIFKYLFIVSGAILILNFIGFNLSSLGWLFGALGVGIGFGLQNITNNFISGIIILFERPIKVGDRIEVANTKGDVVTISMRSTTIITNDNISVIVPNSEFINSNVINWSHNDRRVRFHFPVGVSYSEDPQKVKEIVLKVANENEGVLKTPKPDFWFVEYGDSSLNFELVVWTSTYVQRPVVLKSELYYKIFEEFVKNGIEIPFPQRDINFRNGLEIFSRQNDTESQEEYESKKDTENKNINK